MLHWLLRSIINTFLFPDGRAEKVIREIYADLRSGKQMNRLLQGDVGSGKTIVALSVCCWSLVDEGQTALMAPTEILSQQHYANLKKYADLMGIPIALLTGSTKKSERKGIHEALRNGTLKILDWNPRAAGEEVQFQHLGLCGRR